MPATIAVFLTDSKGNPIAGLPITSTFLTAAAAGMGKSEDAPHVSGDVGVMQLGVRAPAVPVAQTSAVGDYGAYQIDAEGKQTVNTNAVPENTWQVAPAAITVTTAVLLRAAAAAGIRNYLSDITVSNEGATGTLVTILDGATVIWKTWLAPGASIDGAFVTALRGTAATALNVQCSAASTVHVAASGYIGV